MSKVITAEQTIDATWRDYLELAKARIVFMVLVTTAAGFYLAPSRTAGAWILMHTLLGTALVAGGTNALNEYFERDLDRKMKRTRHRPLPDGRISERTALLFSVGISVIGATYLALAVNWLASLLSLVTLGSYLFIYTPLKQKTTFCTVIGAAPGAIPPMIGWAAASGQIDIGAWVLFAIMFLWQMPHFLAISWIYRKDYAEAGFRMLSRFDQDGSATSRHAVNYAFVLLPVSLLPAPLQFAGSIYFVGAFVAGVALILYALKFAKARDVRSARQLFMFSNLYLVAVMSLLVISHIVQLT